MNALRPLVLLLAGAALAACGSDEEAAQPAPTATATATASPLDQALWPDPSSTAAHEPEAVARSFVEAFVGVERPALGKLRDSEPHAGEIDVHRRAEDGRRLDAVVATIQLRQLGGERWFVTIVGSPEVKIDEPEPYAAVASPLRIAGRGRGFEGNVVLEVRAAFSPADAEPLARTPVTAGSMGELEPFAAELRFERPAGSLGAVLVRTGSGIAAADGFAAFPVRFGG